MRDNVPTPPWVSPLMAVVFFTAAYLLNRAGVHQAIPKEVALFGLGCMAVYFAVVFRDQVKWLAVFAGAAMVLFLMALLFERIFGVMNDLRVDMILFGIGCMLVADVIRNALFDK